MAKKPGSVPYTNARIPGIAAIVVKQARRLGVRATARAVNMPLTTVAARLRQPERFLAVELDAWCQVFQVKLQVSLV
jgi:hypothetical protein